MKITRSMRNTYLGMILLGLAILATSTFSNLFAQMSSTGPRGVVLELNGVVEPTVATYLQREIEAANESKADLIVIEIDTPGGLVTSMKDIIKSILASDVPIVTYVSPQGAQSASAGLYIMYSAHISAMAPATNTGAATPVSMVGDGGSSDPETQEDLFPTPEPSSEDSSETNEATEDAPEEVTETSDSTEPVLLDDELGDIPAYSSEDAMRKKVINDSVAYIRSLAEKRDRNADWAELAVREAVSVTANEALELNVIDLLADDMDDLLAKIDGLEVETASGMVTIQTKGMQLERIIPKAVEILLRIITDPTIATILLSIGTLGITAEIWNPGSVFPGVVGVICLLLAFYSFSVIPYDMLWLAVMGVGILLIILEAFTPTFGISGLAGLTLFGVGMYFFVPEEVGRIPMNIIFATLAIGALILGLMLTVLVRSRSQGPLIGEEAIKNREGKVQEWDNDKGTGMVIVDGERWRAKSKSPLSPGDRIKVVSIEGLVLTVKPATSESTISRMLSGKFGRPSRADMTGE